MTNFSDRAKQGDSLLTRLYVFRITERDGGWWEIEQRITLGGAWERVATTFGSKRAEIAMNALAEEANERV